MPIIVEHLTTLLRFGSSSVYGDPFDVACVVRWATPKDVMISGLTGAMKHQYRRELQRWLREHGVSRVVYTRRGKRIVRYL